MTSQVRYYLLVLLALFLFAGGCTSDEAHQGEVSEDRNSNRVIAVSFALSEFTQRIAGDTIQVDFPGSSSDDPKEWSPTVEEVVELQKADVIVINGPGAKYANWLTRVTLDESKFCKTAHNFGLGGYLMIKDYQIVHSHGPEGEHSHPYFVPYCWLDPKLAVKQGEQILASLSAIYPDKKKLFEQNLESLKEDLDSLTSSMSEFATDKKVICINPLPKFLTRSLGVADSHLLYFSKDDLASADEFQNALKTKQNETEAVALVTTFELPDEIAKVVKSLGLEVVNIDLIETPNGGSYIQAMKNNVQKLKDICQANAD